MTQPRLLLRFTFIQMCNFPTGFIFHWALVHGDKRHLAGDDGVLIIGEHGEGSGCVRTGLEGHEVWEGENHLMGS